MRAVCAVSLGRWPLEPGKRWVRAVLTDLLCLRRSSFRVSLRFGLRLTGLERPSPLCPCFWTLAGTHGPKRKRPASSAKERSSADA